LSFEIGQVLETQEPLALDIANVITGRTFLASITRWGKCLHEDTLIALPNGNLKSIRNIIESNESRVCSKGGTEIQHGRITHYFNEDKITDFIRIEPSLGSWLECSVNHHILTRNGMKAASELSAKDRIAIVPLEGHFGSLVLPSHELKLLGYLIAEGSLSKGIGFTNTNEAIVSDFLDALNKFDPTLRTKKSGATIWISSGKKSGSSYRNKLLQWLIYLGLYPSKSRTKRIPDVVLQQSKEGLALFLNRLFAGDSSCSIYWRGKRSHYSTVKIEYGTCSKILASQLSMVLMRFGVFSCVYRTEKAGHPYWRLSIHRVDSVRNFLTNIGIFGKETNNAWEFTYNKKPSSNNKLDRDNEIAWVPIRKIEKIDSPHRVYDLSVEPFNNYIANGIIVHNSWTARKITEECFGHAGIIILDTEGEYCSLREKYPVMIVGKDIPIQIETAEFIAEKVLETNISVIIDLSMTEVELGKEYVDKFLRRFFFLQTTAKKPYLLVIEEADEYAGERGITTSTCVEILRNITKKGGKRGIGILLVSHRPAWVSKGVLSQCTNKAVGKIEWPADLEVLEKYTRIPHAFVEKFPSLGKGEFCFAGDWVKEPVFVKVGQVRTTHLGATPDVIPPSPKELRGVIEGLQRLLPEVIEKVKPTVVPIAEMEAKLKGELEKKYRERIEAIQRTAEEKAERKFKTKIDQLQTHIESLSRSQALQLVAPITDVLEHPIVRTRMLELPEKARDLLIKIEREPRLTREQLAAFLTTSKDTVSGLVDKINRVFHATAIISDGKPVRYKSMLKRLFITDVAKREIEEIEHLQAEAQEERRRREEAETLLRQTKERYKGLEEFYLKHKTDIENLPNLEVKIRDLKSQNQTLTETLKKQADLFGPFLDFFRAIVKEEVSQVQISATAPIDDKKVEALIDQKIKEKLPMTHLPPSGVIPTSVELEHKVTHFDFKKPEEHVKADKTTLQGRIIYLVTKGFFNTRHNRKEVVTELSNNGWLHGDKEVDDVLADLCQLGVFYRKISTGNVFWYTLQPEAKERIHE